MAAVLAVVGLIAALAFGISKLSAVHSAPGLAYLRELQSNRALGMPTNPADLKLASMAPASNAAPIYRELTELLKRRPISNADHDTIARMYSRGNLSRAEIAEARRVLANRPELDDLILKAASRGDCDFQRDYSLGPEVLFPEFAQMRAATRWVAAQSVLMAYDGRPVDGLKHAELGCRMARHAARDQTLIGLLVSVALDSLTLRAIESILYRFPDRPEVASAARDVIRNHWKLESLAWGLRSEYVVQTVILDNLRKYGPSYARSLSGEATSGPDFSSAIVRYLSDWGGFVDRNGIEMLRHDRTLNSVADRPYPESHLALVQIQKQVELGGNDAMLARILFPVFDQAAAKRAGMLARIRVIDSAAALLEWKQKHGRFPGQLAEAAKLVPVDPFDLKPLRYRRMPDGFVVYSVGASGTFGGEAKDKKQYNREAVFRYPAPSFLSVSDPK